MTERTWKSKRVSQGGRRLLISIITSTTRNGICEFFLPFCWHCRTPKIRYFVSLAKEPTMICRAILVQPIRQVPQVISKTRRTAREVSRVSSPDSEMRPEEGKWVAGVWRRSSLDRLMIQWEKTRCYSRRVVRPLPEKPATLSSKNSLCRTVDDAVCPIPLCDDILARCLMLHIKQKNGEVKTSQLHFEMDYWRAR